MHCPSLPHDVAFLFIPLFTKTFVNPVVDGHWLECFCMTVVYWGDGTGNEDLLLEMVQKKDIKRLSHKPWVKVTLAQKCGHKEWAWTRNLMLM